MVQFLSALIYFLLLITSVFLVCLVLIQRGKGGGLAGAFGGGGTSGSSAFGSKAGDVFTRVTMITAGIWIALNMVLVVLSNQRTSAWGDTPIPGSASKSAFSPSTDKTKPVAPVGDSTAPAAANPFDALAPAVPSAPSGSPLGKGGTPSVKDELPASPFGTEPSTPPSALPTGSTPSGGAGNPKP